MPTKKKDSLKAIVRDLAKHRCMDHEINCGTTCYQMKKRFNLDECFSCRARRILKGAK